MNIIEDYYEALHDLRIAYKGIETKYPLLNPQQPLLRTRLVALQSDIEANANISYDAFCGCLPWSVHRSLASIASSEEAPRPSDVDFQLFQQLEIRRLNNGKPLLSHEEAVLESLRTKVNSYNEALFAQFEKERILGMDVKRRLAEATLKAAVRAFLFSCRSYQDALYALFLVSQKERVSEFTSMKKGIENTKLVQLLEGSGYVEWFEKQRDLRNLAKVGATAGVGLGGHNIRVSYDDARNNKFVKVGGNDFNFSDLAKSLKMTALLMARIAS